MGPQHNLGSSVKPLGWFLNVKPEPIGGSNITVGAMAYDRKTGLVSHSAPWRQVVDLGDLNKSSDVVIPGESGHFLSPFYANQQKLHNQGQLHPQLFTPDTYRTGRKLDLRP
jgi:penicillin amidase